MTTQPLDDDRIIALARKHGADFHRVGLTVEFSTGQLLAFARALVEQQCSSDALRDVSAERRRQIEKECWTPDRDDLYSNGDLARAAAAYALAGSDKADGFARNIWPWGGQWWKPSFGRRDLVKAGALILAEIERLDRAPLSSAPTENTSNG